MKCPILSKEIEIEECSNTIDAVKEITNDSLVLKRIKRVNGWRFICKNCPNHSDKNSK